MLKVIFLDIDGVLNCNKSKIDKSTGYVGIDDDKLEKLKEIINKTGAEIVLCSSWKDDWFKESSYKNIQGNLGNLLDRKFRKFDLKIIDKTEDSIFDRGNGIKKYCAMNNIDNFIILDDETFDYENCNLLNNLIKTDYYGDGLNDECAKKAVEMLNKKRK